VSGVEGVGRGVRKGEWRKGDKEGRERKGDGRRGGKGKVMEGGGKRRSERERDSLVQRDREGLVEYARSLCGGRGRRGWG
jgi:hypothetical protein